MVIETIGISLLLGKLTGGKIKNLGFLYISGWYLFVASFTLEIMSLLIVSKTNGNLNKIIENNFFYIHVFIYLLLIIGLIMNFHHRGLRITLIGSILNFLAILFNNGRMPVSIESLNYSKLYNQIDLLEKKQILTHALANETTRLTYLGDIIPIPKPYISPKIISVGDIIIALGLFILIQSYMKKRYEFEGKTIDFYRP